MREEELVKTVEAETKRAEALNEEIKLGQKALEEAKEKLREATRLKTKAQAAQQALKQDFDAAQENATKMERDLDEAIRQVSALRAGEAELVDRLQREEAAAALLREENARLASQLEGALGDVSRLKARAEEADRLEAELKSNADVLEAAKHAARQNTQLVRDLKAELAKQRKPVEAEVQASERVTRELAERLETLLKENAVLRERVTFL